MSSATTNNDNNNDDAAPASIDAAIDAAIDSLSSRDAGNAGAGRSIAILSLDGGGSRGVMEVVVVDVVMRLTTMMMRGEEKPSIRDLLEKSKNVLDLLAKVDDPLHPTSAFDMIVGTSTGGLIAMGLVAGKEEKADEPLGEEMSGREKRKQRSWERPKRIGMTLEEIKQMYRNETKNIFSESAWSWYQAPRWVGICRGKSMFPYTQTPLQKVLERYFGDARLEDVQSGSVGGCVARKVGFGGGEEEMELFSTAATTRRATPIQKVLLATSDAPVYFETPVEIEGDFFVDGGVGGNCPLKQAIPQAIDLWGRDINLFVLSLAPSQPEKKEIPKGIMGQLNYWLLGYFPSQVTSGNLIYNELKASYSSGKLAQFYRVEPKGKELEKFELDELDIDAMIKATESFIRDKGLIDVLQISFAVLAAILSDERRYSEATKKEERRREEKRGEKGEENREEKGEERGRLLSKIYPYVLKESLELVEQMKKGRERNLERDERERNLLLSVEKIVDAYHRMKLPNDFVLEEFKIFKRLGHAHCRLGDQANARRCVLEALLRLKSCEKNKKKNVSEVFILVCLMMCESGEHSDRDGVKGAEWFYQEAWKIMSADEEKLCDYAKARFNRCHLALGYSYSNAGFCLRAIHHLMDRSKLFHTTDEAEEFGKFSREAELFWLLGVSYLRLQNMAKSRECFVQSRSSAESALARATWPAQRVRMTLTDGKGFVSILDGRTDEAIDYFMEAIDQVASVVGQRTHRLMAEKLCNLGFALHLDGKLDPSLIEIRKALEIHRQTTSGPSLPPSAGVAFNLIGANLAKKSEWKEAKLNFEKAESVFLAMREDEPGQEIAKYLSLIIVQSNISCARLELGDIDAAILEFRSAMESLRRTNDNSDFVKEIVAKNLRVSEERKEKKETEEEKKKEGEKKEKEGEKEKKEGEKKELEIFVFV